MNQKWTQKEDQQLIALVKKHGTADWSVIQQRFKGNRSKESVIKRWHCRLKIKKEKEDIQIEKAKTEKALMVKRAPPPIRKEKDWEQSAKTHPITRSQKNIIEKIEDNQVILKRPQITKRFQRLRSFLKDSEPRPKTCQTQKPKPTKIKQPEEKERPEEMVEEEEEQSEDIQSSSLPSKYEVTWTKSDDQKLKNLVINQAVTDWQKLGKAMGCSPKEIMKRWREEVYRMIILEDKVGGSLKYSSQEDAVLSVCKRNGLNWEGIMEFLPSRSEYSIEARWRRAARPEIDVQASKNKHFMMREMLKKILERRRSWKEPVEQKENSVRL